MSWLATVSPWIGVPLLMAGIIAASLAVLWPFGLAIEAWERHRRRELGIDP